MPTSPGSLQTHRGVPVGGRILILVLAALSAACSTGAVPPSTTTAPTTSTSIAPTTSVPSTTTTTTPIGGGDVIALPVATETASAEWTEVLFLPYGDPPERVGTSVGGDSGSLDLGPEYGALAPDGTWWILDVANTRVARFASDGTYLGETVLPEDVLVAGQYVQFQMGRVLADGSFVAIGFRFDGGEATAVLRVSPSGSVSQVLLPGLVHLDADDGMLLYGATGGRLVSVDPTTGAMTTVDAYRTQSGMPYRLSRDGDTAIRIELPDTGVDISLPIVPASDPGQPAFGAWEVASTADGRIHLLFYGWAVNDESTQLAGYTTVLPDGTVTPIVPVRNPFTPSDPGSPAHLGAAFGANEAWLMIIDTDGVRVYQPA